MFADWLQVQEAALAGIALFRQKHANPGQLRFVAQHLSKASEGQLLKMPAGIPARLRFRLPEWTAPDNERTNPFLNQQRNDALAGSVQVLVKTTFALRRQ